MLVPQFFSAVVKHSGRKTLGRKVYPSGGSESDMEGAAVGVGSFGSIPRKQKENREPRCEPQSSQGGKQFLQQASAFQRLRTFPKQPPFGDQVFKHVSLWETFHIQATQTLNFVQQLEEELRLYQVRVFFKSHDN